MSTSSVRPASAAGERALIFASDNALETAFVRDQLIATGLFSSGDVHVLAMSTTPPALDVLDSYDCVISWTSVAPPNAAANGDRLRDYVLDGGGVVLAAYAYTYPASQYAMQGGIMGDGFSPLDATSTPQFVFPRSLDFGTALVGHPVLDGVSDFTYGGNVVNVDVTVDPGATLIGRDDHGVPLLAVNADGNVAGMNLYLGDTFAKSPGVFRALANACLAVANPGEGGGPPGDVNTPPVVDAGGPYSGEEGASIQLNGSASDADGDALTLSWAVAPVSGVDPGASCTFSDGSSLAPTVTCTDDGQFEVSLSADDGHSSAVISTTTLDVGNVSPSLGDLLLSPSELLSVSASLDLVSSFDDPGANDSHSCEVEWGDGESSVGLIDGGECSADHAYTTAGLFTAVLTITDDDGGVGEVSASVAVYDPAAGFITGGGWIDSHQGAYMPDPGAAGRAFFSVTARYKKGALEPDGKFEFSLHEADLQLRSESLQYLIVGADAAYLRGTATVNGVSGYSFLLTVMDGGDRRGARSDRVGIKIWNDEGVLYDSSATTMDVVEGEQMPVVSGGSVVVHHS